MQLRVALSLGILLSFSIPPSSATSINHLASFPQDSHPIQLSQSIFKDSVEEPQVPIRRHKFNRDHRQVNRPHVRRQGSSQIPTAPPTTSLPNQDPRTEVEELNSSSLGSLASTTTTSQPGATPSVPSNISKPTASTSLSRTGVIDGQTDVSTSVIRLLQSPHLESPSISSPSFQVPSVSAPQLQASSISLPSISLSIPTFNPSHSPQRHPSPPQGARLVQFRPSLRSKASVPMLVSDAWQSKGGAPISAAAVTELLTKSSKKVGKDDRIGHVTSNEEKKKKVEETQGKGSSRLKAQNHKGNKIESAHRLPHQSRSENLVESTATSAYISIHGRDRNAPQAFEEVYQALKSGEISLDGDDASTILVAPNFFIASDAGQKPGTSFFNKSHNLWWPAEGHGDGPYGLFDGADAIGPRDQLLLAQISTFDVLDQLVAQFSNLALYPRMRNITVTGHSAGGELIQRWSAIGSYSLPSADEGFGKGDRIHLRMVIANSPSSVFFTSDRPDNPSGKTVVPSRSHKSGKVSKTGCLFDHWRYGFSGKQPRYVELKLAQLGGVATAVEAKGRILFSQWIRKDIVRLVGTLDTQNRASGGDRSCAVKTQGGKNRRDRNYAFWAYQTLLSGSDEDVTDFYGYKNLSRSVKPIPNISHTSQHRLGIVAGVGHVAKRMYQSPVGLSALLDKEVLPGPRPPPMPNSGNGEGSRNVAGGRHKHGGSYEPSSPKLPNLAGNNSASSASRLSYLYVSVSIIASIILTLISI